MTYRPGDLRKRSKEITNARNWGIGLVTAALGFGLFLSELRRIQDLHPDPMKYAYLALLVLTGVLIFLWIWATQKELDLLFDWLDPERYVPPSSFKETFLILFCALVLIALLYAARDPLIYGVVFTAYSAGCNFAGAYRDRELAAAIDRSKKRLTDDFKDPSLSRQAKLYWNGVEALESYFIKSPMMKRGNMCTIASIVGLLLALNWKLRAAAWSGFAAYLLYIALIIVAETVIYRWRLIRDSRVREIESELSELVRNEQP